MNQKYFYLLLAGIFLIRVLYGLSYDFWSEDELQLYLIGLKSYTTDTWPYYGPDVVYTQTQIAGALQGLLIRIPLEIVSIPESPIVFMNILIFMSLSFLAHYICLRITTIPRWVIWSFVLMNTWAVHYGTKIYNPTYALIFSIPFFIAAIELLKVYKEQVINEKLSFVILGFGLTTVMQFHLSWVTLIPFVGLAFILRIRKTIQCQFKNFALFSLGAIIGGSTLIPTFFNSEEQSSVASNIVFKAENWSNIFPVILKFLAYGTNEVNYLLFANPGGQLAVFEKYIWMAPFAIALLIGQFVILGLMLFGLFKKGRNDFKRLRLVIWGTMLLLYFSFFFSIKSPTPHTMFMLYPLAILFAFHCFEWSMRWKYSKLILKVISISLIVFHFGNGLYKIQHTSIIHERGKVIEAIEKKDYKIVGERRADYWGYGY